MPKILTSNVELVMSCREFLLSIEHIFPAWNFIDLIKFRSSSHFLTTSNMGKTPPKNDKKQNNDPSKVDQVKSTEAAATDDSSKSKQETPTKAASPARKAKTTRKNSQFSIKTSRAEQIKFKRVGIDGVGIALSYKSNGTDPSYLGTCLSHLQSKEEKMELCKVAMFTKLRNPESNEPLQKPNKVGNLYPVDVVVISTDGEIDVNKACTNLAKTLGEIAKNECKTEFQFGIPIFMNKGDCTPPTVLPLSYYLMDFDCITIIKRIFEDADTKEQLMANSERDNILKIVFGEANKGTQVLEQIEEEVYEEL